MNGRDAKWGAAGLVLGAAVVVAALEGKALFTRGKESTAGGAAESGRADAQGGRRTTGSQGAGALAQGHSGAGAGAGNEKDPLLVANANLADTVRDYKNRLSSLADEKTRVEKELADAQQRLAIAAHDGQVPPKKSAYDLGEDDWKELAAKGEVRARLPCTRPESWSYKQGSLDKLGLSPDDGKTLRDAFAASNKRTWAELRPLCQQALGAGIGGDVVDRIGPGACQAIVFDHARTSGVDVDERMRRVAEMRAGMIPMPDKEKADPIERLLLAFSGESKQLEADLAAQLGPDGAHRAVYEEVGCWQNSSWGAGPRPKKE